MVRTRNMMIQKAEMLAKRMTDLAEGLTVAIEKLYDVERFDEPSNDAMPPDYTAKVNPVISHEGSLVELEENMEALEQNLRGLESVMREYERLGWKADEVSKLRGWLNRGERCEDGLRLSFRTVVDMRDFRGLASKFLIEKRECDLGSVGLLVMIEEKGAEIGDAKVAARLRRSLQRRECEFWLKEEHFRYMRKADFVSSIVAERGANKERLEEYRLLCRVLDLLGFRHGLRERSLKGQLYSEPGKYPIEEHGNSLLFEAVVALRKHGVETVQDVLNLSYADVMQILQAENMKYWSDASMIQMWAL